MTTSTSECALHGVPLVEEPGGADRPTVCGRRYCPVCQAELMDAFDRHDQIREGAIRELIQELDDLAECRCAVEGRPVTPFGVIHYPGCTAVQH